LIEGGATTRDEIDIAVILGLGFPRGILRMADSEGIDVIVDELNRLTLLIRKNGTNRHPF